MVSLKLSLSRSTSSSSMAKDGLSDLDRPPSASSNAQDSIASSSSSSVVHSESEDVTISVKKVLDNGTVKGKHRSIDDLRLLAISTNMTELSYNISDIQTRIFEIEELRHQTQSSQDPQGSSSGVIDHALMSLDERLEVVNRGMKAVADALEPLLSQTPKPDEDQDNERALLLRKHRALLADWESVQDETDVLREELKEDKWLTVFRTVSEQADGMMSSLEKAIQRCQEFIWRVRKRVPTAEDTLLAQASPNSRDAAPLTYETFCTLQDSYEAKKKHYMPATSKVLSIIDKGVQDRVTKNGECLRRHAESTQRWKNLRERIIRTDAEMETVRKVLLMQGSEPDEFGSVSERTSRSSHQGHQGNGHLVTPHSTEFHRRVSSGLEVASNSISPLRKIVKRIGGRLSGRATPISKNEDTKPPSSDPLPNVRNRQSMFMRNASALTPERPTHKHSQSLMTPESPTIRRTNGQQETIKSKPPKWNSSTKVGKEEPARTKHALTKRTSSANLRSVSSSYVPPVPPIPATAPVTPNLPRSQSRSSFASSRPWSPITASNGSTTRSSISRPPSRSHTPFGFETSPRARPKTPSHIPVPAYWKGSSNSSDASVDDRSPPNSSIMQRISPPCSTSSAGGVSAHERSETPLGTPIPYPRPPSRSMIPIPRINFQSTSRPSTAMSNYYDRPDTSMSFRSSAHRAQTPEATLRGRVQQLPYYHDNASSISPASSRRISRAPPSSFRRESSVAPPLPSRPGSRAGAYTPSFDSRSMHAYIPVNSRDPLDAEVAAVSNSIPHGLLIERLDPPLKAIPKDNEEIKAQYAFSNHLARKVVTCRLLTMSRTGVKTRKVMCRVGGGWQELSLYLLSRQAGN